MPRPGLSFLLAVLCFAFIVAGVISFVAAILAHQWYQWKFGVVIIPVLWIAIAAIYFTVLVSTISAIDYFVGFWKQIDHASKDRRKAFVLGRRKSPSIS